MFFFGCNYIVFVEFIVRFVDVFDVGVIFVVGEVERWFVWGDGGFVWFFFVDEFDVRCRGIFLVNVLRYGFWLCRGGYSRWVDFGVMYSGLV